MHINDVHESITIRQITSIIRNFAKKRNWQRYHTPRSLTLALMGELGELAELFQFKTDVDNTGDANFQDESCATVDLPTWSSHDKDKVGQEFADVAIYLFRLADICDIDIGRYAMEIAMKKKKTRGSSVDTPRVG